MTTTTQPQTPQRFGLPESAIEAIQQVLAAHPEVEQAIVYGSRAMGRQRLAVGQVLYRRGDGPR